MAKKTNYLLRKKFRTKSKPIIPLGPYTKPRLTAIKLDPEQAVIASCRVAGANAYFDWADTRCHYSFTGGACFGVRGNAGNYAFGGGRIDTLTIPS